MDRFPPGFAVVDVETTGLRSKADRIIEVAVVRLDAAGSPIAELSTLVDPERNPGASHIHGLSAEDLDGAPRFTQILGELFRYLDGAVVVGHNVMFDISFLREELVRAGIAMPMFPFLCTRDLSQVVLPDLGEYRLARCCRALGISQGPEHQALEDAKATTFLFAKLWTHDEARRNYPRDLQYAHSLTWPTASEPARIYSREEAAHKRRAEEARMANLVASLPEGASNQSVDGYLGLLDELLEDRYITEDKSKKALEFIQSSGLRRDDVTTAHRQYVNDVARAAIAADLGQSLASADVRSVASLLGLSDDDATNAMELARMANDKPLRKSTRPLRAGLTVCFTGDPIPDKDELGRRASAAGLVVKDSVTKKLDVLVVDLPRSMSAKAQKARALGKRILAVPVFLMALAEMA